MVLHTMHDNLKSNNIMKKIFILFFLTSITINQFSQSLPSLGSYVWKASDEPKTFNNKLQLSFVRSDDGFPQYGTVLAGGAYTTGQDGGVFQLYFPYNELYGGVAPKIRLGKYPNQGWSDWETFYTSANSNSNSVDWNSKKLYAKEGLGIGTNTLSNPISVQKVSSGVGYGNSDGKGGIRVRWSTGYGVSLDAWDGGTPRWGITKFVQEVPTVMIEGRYNSNDVIFNSGGNVGIGTTSPSAKLDVNGNIRAERIDVVSDVPASDYVFDQGYNLRSLPEVEQYVKTNKHLPEVPSATEFKETATAWAKWTIFY